MVRPEFIDIRQEDIDAWYEISWDEQGKRLIVKIHRALEEQLDRLTPDAPIIDHFINYDKIPLDPYIPPTKPNWGFGQILQRVDTEEPFIVWAIDIPRVMWMESGERKYDWKQAYNISASLNILFLLLSIYKREEIIWESSRSQLIICRSLTTDVGQHGGSLTVTIAKTFLPWFKDSITDDCKSTIEQAMRTAYYQMFQDREAGDLITDRALNMQIRSKTGLIHFNCPGQACGLDPDFNCREDEGYDLEPHNVDTPAQQLTFLVGVAAMCDLARAQLF